MFPIAFTGLGNCQNGPRGLWQIKTVLEMFKTLVKVSGSWSKVSNSIQRSMEQNGSRGLWQI